LLEVNFGLLFPLFKLLFPKNSRFPSASTENISFLYSGPAINVLAIIILIVGGVAVFFFLKRKSISKKLAGQ